MRKRTKIFSVLLIALLTIITVDDYIKSQPKISTYKIKEEINYGDKFLDWVYGVKEDNRKHAIIQIVGNGGLCTAFVINDTAALTAGHCMELTKMDIEETRPKLLEVSTKLEKNLRDLIRYLESKCSPMDMRCLAELNKNKMRLDKELKARAKLLSKKPDSFDIIDVNGDDTGIKATAFSKGNRRDYGFITGDFKGFKKMPIRAGWTVKRGDVLKACGFFGGKMPPYCTDFRAIGNYKFYYAGEGVFAPGVSGGPVIDHLGYAVGIATHVKEEFVVMLPIIGLINILTPEQEKKHEKRNKSR